MTKIAHIIIFTADEKQITNTLKIQILDMIAEIILSTAFKIRKS